MPLMVSSESSIDYNVYGEGPPLLLIAGLAFGRCPLCLPGCTAVPAEAF
jgi:hypothetical protein